jgi:glycogen synthase
MWVSNYGTTIGGGPVLAPLLAEALVRRRHEITVLTDRRPETLASNELRGGVTIHRPMFRRALAGDMALVSAIRKQILDFKNDWRPEISLIFSSRYGDYFHSITQGKSSPLILSLHDCFPNERYLEDSLLGRHLRTASRVIACSNAVLAAACDHVPNLSNIASVVRNALPMPSLVAKVPRNRVRPKLAYLGRLISQKGIDVLIAALAILLLDHPDLRLEIAGIGDGRPALEQQIAGLELTQAVEFKGELDRAEAYAFLSDAEIVVVPSRLEPFGLVALEAAQVGRPVVASAVGGLPEVVVHSETGLLVPAGDPEALARAIDSLLKDPARLEQLGRRAQEHASRRFRWDDYVDSYESLLEAACH